MGYCTEEDITKKYGKTKVAQLSGSPSGQDIESDAVGEAIESADALIEGYAGKRYSMPFTTVPIIIKNLSRDLAFLELKKGSKMGWSERDERQNGTLIKLLKDMGAGRVEIGADDTTETVAGPVDSFKSNTRIFTRQVDS